MASKAVAAGGQSENVVTPVQVAVYAYQTSAPPSPQEKAGPALVVAPALESAFVPSMIGAADPQLSFGGAGGGGLHATAMSKTPVSACSPPTRTIRSWPAVTQFAVTSGRLPQKSSLQPRRTRPVEGVGRQLPL